MRPLDAMRAVFSGDHKLRESERSVLAVLVLHRNNETGLCCPGQPRIARETGMGTRGVGGILRRLESAGIIMRDTRAGLSTRYAIHLDKLGETTEATHHVPPVNDVPPLNEVPGSVEAGATHPRTTFHRTAVVTAPELPTPTDEVFEKAWNAYPRRPGRNRTAAFKKWQARIREGVDASAMLDGVLKYAAFIRATDKEGTPYVKQAETFFGPNKHWLDDFEASTTAPSTNGRHVGRLR